MKRVLLVPSLKKKGGTGHLLRCVRLLGLCGPGSRILVSGGPGEWNRGEVLSLCGPRLREDQLAENPDGSYDFILCDRRATSADEYFRLSAGRPCVGLDEGGPARPFFSFIIDTFPRLSSRFPANINDEGLIAESPPAGELPVPAALKTALLSFGGEDPAGLTGLTLAAFDACGLFPPHTTGIVEGPAFRVSAPRERGTVYAGRDDIRPLFADYDCVFTSFGITPYEALAAGRVPVLVNPSPYHEKLSRKAGFYSLGAGKISRRRLKKIAASPALALPRRGPLAAREDFAAILGGLSASSPAACPVCGSPLRGPLLRLREASFFRCRDCGISYREGFSATNIRYDKNYFFEDYRRQYGKTYLEDFAAITGFARQRLACIARLCGAAGGKRGLTGKTLLDIGCAYGPFVAAARDAGCVPRGIDIAEDAARHVSSVLGIPALAGDFLDLPPETLAPEGPYDIVSLWFVIEHFRQPDKALEKIAGLLVPGGILAFSTPNLRGVSGLFCLKKFLAASPADHVTLWDPRSSRKALARFGLRVLKIRVTGHHGERFPFLMRLLLRQRGCSLISRVFGLGDTFEVYAEKMA
ncbi:MAG: class I SAM-dependent methyltransferase [Spirochaetaceae bacterium]|nr:class I SAM-dependent methyltransferase [Spirochaetaceae bacterium]